MVVLFPLKKYNYVMGFATSFPTANPNFTLFADYQKQKVKVIAQLLIDIEKNSLKLILKRTV